MATAEQLKALLKSYADGDDDRFLAISLQVASHAAQKGQGKLAQELRILIDQAKLRQKSSKGHSPVPIAKATGELEAPVGKLSEGSSFGDGPLAADEGADLPDHLGVPSAAEAPGDTASPPGANSCWSAPRLWQDDDGLALAGNLASPSWRSNSTQSSPSSWGRQPRNSTSSSTPCSGPGASIFSTSSTPSGRAARANDVGEIRRVLNSFLQFLEQDDSDSIIIAATNHVGKLDSALFRRFDDVVRYELPTPEFANKLIKNRLGLFGVDSLKWGEILSAAKGPSYAELSRACDDAARKAISPIARKSAPRTYSCRRSAAVEGSTSYGPATIGSGGWSWKVLRSCVTFASMTGRMQNGSFPRRADAIGSRCPRVTGCRTAPV